MSITKTINEDLRSRAYQVTIDKSEETLPRLILKYTNEKEFLKQESIFVSELVEKGLVTEEQVQEVETLFKALADEFNPYKEEAE